MDIPPSIPTSFVPQSDVNRREQGSVFVNVFGFIGYGLFVLTFLLAAGVFGYGRILNSTLASKNTELDKIESSIDPATVEGFVRLRDRLNSASSLLDNHIALSGFFSALETILPTPIRFTSLDLSLGGDNKVVKLSGGGLAKSFNTLAAASQAFATDGRIKNAIFSNIAVNKDSSVSFLLTATLDPKAVTFTP